MPPNSLTHILINYAPRQVVLLLCAAAILLPCASCTTEEVRKINPEEQARFESAAGTELAHQLEKNLKIRKDAEVSIYLRRLAESLAGSVTELRGASVGILVVDDRDGRWRNFGLPGNRIYLSAGLLRSMDFENELAAAIAIEIGHLTRRHVVQRLEENISADRPDRPDRAKSVIPPQPEDLKAKTVDFFGQQGVFIFSDENRATATEDAVGILYGAGYDPRGLAALFLRYKENPAHAPWDPGTNEKLVVAARRAIAQYAPLRNPVVRSPAFLAIQQRIRQMCREM